MNIVSNKKVFLKFTVIFMCLLLLFISYKTINFLQESIISSEEVWNNQQEFGIADANTRMSEIANQTIDSSIQGKWEITSQTPSWAYMYYVSPNFTKNNKSVYVVLEYMVSPEEPFTFIGYKFFLKEENYNFNHRQ